MHDINFIRENPTQFDEGLKKRFLEPQSQIILDLDIKKRELLTKSQDLRSERKNLSSEFSKLNNEEKESLQKKVQIIKNEIEHKHINKAILSRKKVKNQKVNVNDLFLKLCKD